jgi:hypothetical protein
MVADALIEPPTGHVVRQPMQRRHLTDQTLTMINQPATARLELSTILGIC